VPVEVPGGSRSSWFGWGTSAGSSAAPPSRASRRVGPGPAAPTADSTSSEPTTDSATSDGSLDAMVDMGLAANRKHAKKLRKFAARTVSSTLGKDGVVTHVAERLPVVSNVAWAVHKVRGNSEQADRARDKNPLGTDGFMTRTAEMVPGVADALSLVHKYRGEDEAAERARGYSLMRNLGSDGGFTKTAELLPGSNLVVALMMEARGDHKEAKKALNLIHNWRNAGSADGAFMKLAEMFPGTDLLAFGRNLQNGDFARALRSICKTRFVDITASRVLARLEVATVGELSMRAFDIGDFAVHPVAGPLVGALMDLVGKLAESAEGVGGGVRKMLTDCVGADVGPVVCNNVNNSLTTTISTQLDNLPQTFTQLIKGVGESLAAKRKQGLLYRCVLPSQIPRLPEEFVYLLQDLVPRISLMHGELPQVPMSRPRYRPTYQKGLPEYAGAVSCLSFTGCVGLGCHTGFLGCIAGCVAGISQGLRSLSAGFVPTVNKHNAASWEAAETPSTPMRRPSTDTMESIESRARQHGIIVEVPDVPELVDILTDYILRRMLPTWRVGRICGRLLQSILPPIRAFLGDLIGDRSGTIQAVISVSVPGQRVSLNPVDTLRIPAIPLAIILDLHLTGSGPPLSRVRVALADNIMGHVLETTVTQVCDFDLRNMDVRLKGFVEPLNLEFDLQVLWDTPSTPKVVVQNLHLRMRLPS